MNSGSRGGRTASLAQAQEMFRRWKPEEYGWLKARILLIARQKGEFHGDHLEGTELTERSIIGATVNALVRAGLIRSTGEHRRSRTAAGHARRSYVYVLTEYGESVLVQLPRIPREELPVRPENVRSVDEGKRKKSRRKIIRGDHALFEGEQGYDAPTVPVEPDEQDVAARHARPIDMAEFLAGIAAWEPYMTDEDRAIEAERLRTSPFLNRDAFHEGLSWDAE